MSLERLRSVDLNLLVVLDVLLQEKSVSKAAERLHLTPSAVSHALKRLRTLFEDELLVRDGRRMSPTVRALELSEVLPRTLAQLAGTLARREPFQPASSRRTFRLAAPDFIAPLVLQAVAVAAPEVRVEWVPASPMAAEELIQGRFDALVAPQAFKNDRVRGQVIGAWPWRVFGRSGHPAFREWSLEAWLAYPHLQIGTSVLRGKGPIDQRLQALGLSRRIAAVVPHFAMAAAVVAETDLLLTVPSMTMHHAAEAYPLERRHPPIDLPPVRLSIFRSAISGEEEGVRWFLNQVQEACQGLERGNEHLDGASEM